MAGAVLLCFFPAVRAADLPEGEASATQAGQAAGPASVSGPASPVAGEAEGSKAWGIPPIRWFGNVGYAYRRASADDGSRGADHLLTTNLRASSYIYAPWMATVSGNLGLITGANNNHAGEGESGAQSDDTRTHNTSIVGNGNLDLFPSSRFPFSANLSRSDSRVGGTILSSNYTETRLGLRQNYRSEDSQHNVMTGFDSSVVTLQAGKRDMVNALYGSYSLPFGGFNNSLATRLSVSERSGTGEGSTLFSLNSSHSLLAQEDFSVSGYTNYTDNRLRYDNNGKLTESLGQFLQLGTSASWRPEFEDRDDTPLNLTAALLFSDSRTSNAGAASQSQRLNGTLSGYYRFSNNLSANGSGILNYATNNNAPSQLGTMLVGNVGYVGDPLMFENFSYNWNASGNGSWQGSSGTTPGNLFFGAQLGHSLGRNFIMSGVDSISLSLSQNFSAYQNQNAGSSSSLTHGVMGSYRMGVGEHFTGSVTGNLSDIMTSGITAQHYRSFNLGLNGMGQLSPRSSAMVNLSFVWTDQTTTQNQLSTDINGLSFQTAQTTTVQRMNLAGSASYNHVRFAGVPNLRYTFLFTADTRLRDDRLMGDVNGQTNRARYTVDNRWDYHIGLLDLRLSATTNDTGGKKNALFFFQVSRQIGAY